MNVGDDVTINGIITWVSEKIVGIKTKSGCTYIIPKEDINTVRPKIEIPEKDERRGN